MNFRELAEAIGILTVMSLVVVIAFQGKPPELAENSPKATVLRTFSAYKAGDVEGVSHELSKLGHVSASFFCGGLAATCLSDNYGQLGELLSEDVTLIHQTETSARVVLKTTWKQYATPVCQEYAVNNTEAGWRVTYIDNLRHCETPSAKKD